MDLAITFEYRFHFDAEKEGERRREMEEGSFGYRKGWKGGREAFLFRTATKGKEKYIEEEKDFKSFSLCCEVRP